MSIYAIWSWQKKIYDTGGRSQSNNLSQSRVNSIQSAESTQGHNIPDRDKESNASSSQ